MIHTNMNDDEKNMEDTPISRDRWSSEMVISAAKGAGIVVETRQEALQEIGKRLSIWAALLGSLKVSLNQLPEENPLFVIKEVHRIVKDNERLLFENNILKAQNEKQ